MHSILIVIKNLSGEILQKFATYYVQLVIVGDFSDIKSENFQALIFESNRGKQTFFVKDIEAAKEIPTL